MTPNPLTVSPQEKVEACMILMRQHGFRHLPICDGAQLQGFISLRDILLHDLDEKDDEVRMMRALHSDLSGDTANLGKAATGRARCIRTYSFKRLSVLSWILQTFLQ